MVDWENRSNQSLATAVYTASWIAPKSDVHSQQRFLHGAQGRNYCGSAHRGYSMAADDSGLSSLNPLFIRYTPDADGFFAGQSGYGYKSMKLFVLAADRIRRGEATPEMFVGKLATAQETLLVTAILEAGQS